MDAIPKISIPLNFNPFSFRGRTKILGMWIWSIIAIILFFIILVISSISGRTDSGSYYSMAWFGIFQIIPAWLLWATAVRRLHDHSLSGNWLFFLSPIGIALMYMAHVLDLDDSLGPVVEKIQKSGVFNWIMAAAAWFFASVIILFSLLFLCTGKREDNMFGPNPYPPGK